MRYNIQGGIQYGGIMSALQNSWGDKAISPSSEIQRGTTLAMLYLTFLNGFLPFPDSVVIRQEEGVEVANVELEYSENTSFIYLYIVGLFSTVV